MAKGKNGTSTAVDENNARLVTSDEDRVKASKWFQRARELGDKRQFDYAIEYYVNGLEFWPDAVEEACKPLHGCGVARKHMGGKKPGLKDTMKRSMNDKDARKALLNALWLFGHDPASTGYIEGVIKGATRLGADDAAKWAAGVFLKALDTAQKVNVKQFQSLALLTFRLLSLFCVFYGWHLLPSPFLARLRNIPNPFGADLNLRPVPDGRFLIQYVK